MSTTIKNIIAEAASELVLKHHIKLLFDGTQLSVITSYKRELEEIALKYRLELDDVHIQQFTVQGIFKVPI